MKTILRTLAIFAAAALVIGATVLLTPAAANGTGGRRRPPRAQVQTDAAAQSGAVAPQTDQFEGLPRSPRGERGGGGFSVFGIGQVLTQLVIVAGITVVFVSVERLLQKRSGTAPEPEEP